MGKLRNIAGDYTRGKFVISNIRQIEQTTYADNPSVKMVLSGNEHYTINGHHYKLGLQRFLVVDHNSHIALHIDADEAVKGVCIFPNKDFLNEVAKTRVATPESLLEQPFENKDINLIHNQFNYHNNRTGRFLKQQVPLIIQLQERNETIDFESFFTRLTEYIIVDQLELEGKLKNISTAKKATKEELYRRVAVAKEILEDNFTHKISLDDLAQEAFLSKYHFTRTFKALFQLSPYQYLLELRLQKAQELLSLDYSYNEVSDLIGFSDGNNLRKAIKKRELNRKLAIFTR